MHACGQRARAAGQTQKHLEELVNVSGGWVVALLQNKVSRRGVHLGCGSGENAQGSSNRQGAATRASQMRTLEEAQRGCRPACRQRRAESEAHTSKRRARRLSCGRLRCCGATCRGVASADVYLGCSSGKSAQESGAAHSRTEPMRTRQVNGILGAAGAGKCWAAQQHLRKPTPKHLPGARRGKTGGPPLMARGVSLRASCAALYRMVGWARVR